MANRPSRLVVPAFALSYDGHYHLRYPHGDKPVTGAELVAHAEAIAAATGAFGAQIRLGGLALGRAGAAGGLSTAIRLAALANARAFASAAFPTDGLQATHYVAPDAGGSGIGTISNPFTLQQACALAQPGWHVKGLPGDYIGPNRASRFEPTFRIAANGTESNPIIFFTENYAAVSSVGRSNLQHTGTQQGSGCPVLGLSTGHCWVGWNINEDQAPSTPDTGPVVVSGAFNRLSYMRISRGQFSWPQAENNQAAIRFEGSACRYNVVSDCWIEQYSGIGSNGSQQGIQLFSTNNNPSQTTGLLLVEHCYFDWNQFAMTCKGAGSARPLHGGIVFRRNLVRTANRGNSGGVAYMDTDGTLGRNQVYQNIFVGGNCAVRTMNQGGYPTRDVDIINNTAINLVSSDDFVGLHADLYAISIGSGWRIHNNVHVGTAVPLFKSPYSVENDSAVQSRSHNISQASQWGYIAGRGAGTQTLAQWVANTPYDRNSINANAQLVSSAWGSPDLGKLGPASPARNAGLDFLNLNGAGTSAPCDMGAWVVPSEQIGIRPLGSAG